MNFKKFVPNFISLFRILCCPLFISTLSNDWNLLSIFIITIAGESDFFDGYLARKFNATSKFGELLDPLADKIFCNSVLWSIYFFDKAPCPLLLILIAIPLTIRDLFLVFGTVFICFQGVKIETKPIYLSKICTLLIFVFSILSMIPGTNSIFLIVLGLFCLFSILLSAFLYFKRFFQTS
ncbi:MAG: CDP-alcohol phosphatidyltransferase family protein [Holosporales bacterium]|nr:CDP-alcohol phosphatidyltransferase family protein [Holosporales bacterium]